ncbi:MAG: BamA/TamA family outer membrane protein [Candidatus Aminicenantes bacterium]|uniref:Outer membrane protein n=1 Tax=Candidatus Saccharicenans subterraneus TaxID=2508984 RepID=A0A3E2BN15_9BACT|nr:BamA/TamA family outer membrane protein [Candidatus Aminicenantes bacterium]RFT16027.1 MAG: Outer membrane protein [Candidatus Saccharicenans subterraneum]
MSTENKRIKKTARVSTLFLCLFLMFLTSDLFSQKTAARKDGQQIVISEESEPDRMGLTLLPIVYYTPETRLAFGLGSLITYRFGLVFKKARPSTMFVGAIYTQLKQFILQIKPEIYLNDNSLFLAGNFMAERFPTKLWGIGPNTPDEMEEVYTPQRFLMEVGLQQRLGRELPLYLGLKYRLESTKIVETEPGKLLDQDLVTGSRGGLLSGPGLAASYDNRDNIFYPNTGLYLQANLNWNNHFFGSDYDFLSLQFDLRNYHRVGDDQVLAVQALAETNTGDVPFYRLPRLGGDSLLRGFYNGRFRDMNLVAFQAEYRFPVWKRLGAVIFGAMGSLANRFRDISFDNLKYAAGFGLRFKIIPKENANLRVDLAFGPGTYGIYFKAGESF